MRVEKGNIIFIKNGYEQKAKGDCFTFALSIALNEAIEKTQKNVISMIRKFRGSTKYNGGGVRVFLNTPSKCEANFILKKYGFKREVLPFSKVGVLESILRLSKKKNMTFFVIKSNHAYTVKNGKIFERTDELERTYGSFKRNIKVVFSIFNDEILNT